MQKLGLLTATAVVVAVMGFGGTAKADPTVEQLINEGAEDGVLPPWTADDAAGGVIDNPNCGNNCGARNGVWFFNTDLGSPNSITPGNSVTIDQDVDVTGCGVDEGEGLAGSWTADGFVFTDSGADTGQLVVLLDDGSGASSAAINTDPNGPYVQMGPISGPIDAAATSANVSMIGADANTDGDAFADFDDMSFRITCIADFAKISGVKGVHEGKGPGGDKGPRLAFSGIVGTFDDPGAETTGTIVINYRQLGPTTCTFTPNAAIVYDGSGGASVSADYACVGGDKDGTNGTATIDLTSKGETECPSKDRGSVAVNASDADLDILGSEGNTEGENCLARGNVIIDDDVQG